MLPALDLHSRVVGLGAGWAERGALSQPERLVVTQLTGAYRADLQGLALRLPPAEQAAYDRLTSGVSWQLATSGEDDLAVSGKLGVPMAGWLTAESTVSASMLKLWSDNGQLAENAALAAANRTLSRSVLLGSLVLVLTVAAFVAALVLANGLVRRLRRLRTKTLELADVKLPSWKPRGRLSPRWGWLVVARWGLPPRRSSAAGLPPSLIWPGALIASGTGRCGWLR
jgi:hypothetical protein